MLKFSEKLKSYHTSFSSSALYFLLYERLFIFQFQLKYIISIMIYVHVNITTFSQSCLMYDHSHRLAVTIGELYVSVNMTDHMNLEHRQDTYLVCLCEQSVKSWFAQSHSENSVSMGQINSKQLCYVTEKGTYQSPEN